jgi:hypothetical protein
LLFNLTLARINPQMRNAVVGGVFAEVGTLLAVGGKLMDLTVDLSEAAAHDCPPISYYRLVVRDKVWLRRLSAGVGDTVEVGGEIALFSTEPDEPLDGPIARQVRTASVGIVPQTAWDEGSF